MKKEIKIDYIECSRRLRQLRKERGISHATLSDAVGISEQTLKNYEQAAISEGFTERARMIAGMSIDNLYRLAKYFGVTTDYMLALDDCRSIDPDIQQVCEYTLLTEESVNNLHLMEDEDIQTINELLSSKHFWSEVMFSIWEIKDIVNSIKLHKQYGDNKGWLQHKRLMRATSWMVAESVLNMLDELYGFRSVIDEEIQEFIPLTNMEMGKPTKAGEKFFSVIKEEE